MKVTVIPIVIGFLGTVIKGFVQGLEDLEITGRVGTVKTTALLRSARILRRVTETWEDLLSPKPQWKTVSRCLFEKLSRINIITIWYKYQSETIIEAKEASIVWVFAVETDRKIKNNWQDIVVKYNKRKHAFKLKWQCKQIITYQSKSITR